MMRRMEQNLRTPGPTPIPAEVREAQAQPMIDHRGTEFAELLHETSAGLAELIGTSGEVLLLTGSGSGAMEAAVVNTLSPGHRVLVVTIGAFGDRFAKIAGAFGAYVERFEVDWGQSASPDALRAHLQGRDPYRAVLVTHNETSTGVANPMRELATVVRGAPGEPLLIVDGISGLGAMPFDMDAWGVDLVISASQKAWMASPGIAIAALGERAIAAGESARMPRVYWDFAEARDWAGKGQTPWTPAVAVLYGLRIGVQRLRAEGRERTWARHEAIARAVAAHRFDPGTLGNLMRMIREAGGGYVYEDGDAEHVRPEVRVEDVRGGARALVNTEQNRFVPLSAARESLRGRVSELAGWSVAERDALASAMLPLLRPTVLFDAAATEEAREAAAADAEEAAAAAREAAEEARGAQQPGPPELNP
jgi:aspartate aminotransferase-like enzyme